MWHRKGWAHASCRLTMFCFVSVGCCKFSVCALKQDLLMECLCATPKRTNKMGCFHKHSGIARPTRVPQEALFTRECTIAPLTATGLDEGRLYAPQRKWPCEDGGHQNLSPPPPRDTNLTEPQCTRRPGCLLLRLDVDWGMKHRPILDSHVASKTINQVSCEFPCNFQASPLCVLCTPSSPRKEGSLGVGFEAGGRDRQEEPG